MKERLDQLLCERGLAKSRQRAQSLILSGVVRVEGRKVDKPGTRISPEKKLEVLAPDHPFVGRGGVKLAAALRRFGIQTQGFTCIDVGASTGGFTDCLLQNGAERVIAVDVGRGQLDWKLRNDPRVTVIERCNARYLTRETVPHRLDLATVDVSFISLRMILPPLLTLQLQGPILALVKPQFELRRGEVGRGGVVRDPALQARTVREIAGFAGGIGLGVEGVVESPITGAEGNREFFLHLSPHARDKDVFRKGLEEIFDER